MKEKQFGKIESASFGLGGYQGAMIGLHISLSGKAWGACVDKCVRDAESIECGPNAKWTEAGRSKQYDEIVRYASKLLKQAKVSSVEQLKGIPVEATFDGMKLVEWRILEEVL